MGGAWLGLVSVVHFGVILPDIARRGWISVRRRIVTGLALLGLVLGAGSAGAIVEAIVVPRGHAVTFAGDRGLWSCLNGGKYSPNLVTCINGDARPYATLSKQGIVVRVYNTKRACVKRVLRPSPDPSDPQMHAYWEFIYLFKPFGGC